jgi:hypothetical protein
VGGLRARGGSSPKGSSPPFFSVKTFSLFLFSKFGSNPKFKTGLKKKVLGFWLVETLCGLSL